MDDLDRGFARPRPLPPLAYERLVQSIVDYAICMLDPEGRIVSWNPGGERIEGYSAAEIVGRHFSRFYTPEDIRAGAPETALKVAAEAGRFTEQGWRVRKDGARFWAMMVIDPIREGDRLVGFAQITRDMTEERREQIKVLEGESRFRLLVQGVTDYALFMLDPEGLVANWNPGAARIKGYTADEIVGRHFSTFYTPEDVAARLPWSALETARREGRFLAEGWRQRKGGERFWASVAIDAIRDEAGEIVGFAKVTRDLTERREAQLALEKSQQALFQAQKMEAVGQLTGGLAHDFNNLLTGITASLELVRMRLAQGRAGDVERYIGAAMGAAARAAGLTHRLLAFSRQQTLEPAVVDPNRLVAGMEELIRRTIGPGVSFGTALRPDVGACFVDPNQLESAILNLCLNARDAMPEGGRLTIETQVEEKGQGDPDLVDGAYVVVSVTDTGTGMSREVAARAFDPFFTTKPAGKGTGLGLSMIYGFAKQSNGHVAVDSQLGRGTTVKIYLPRRQAEAVGEPSAKPAASARPVLAGQTVLVVEDEPIIRMLVGDTLSELGCQAVEAGDPPSALMVLESDARVDLLITDFGLPGGMNGKQMADAARLKRPGLKVLFITGYADNAALSGGSLDPGMHVLAKPFAMEALAARIQTIIGAA